MNAVIDDDRALHPSLLTRGQSSLPIGLVGLLTQGPCLQFLFPSYIYVEKPHVYGY